MENECYDEFSVIMARDWAREIVSKLDERRPLDKLNNQIQTAPTDDHIHMLTGIEMLADILGASLQEGMDRDGKLGKFFVFEGKNFFQESDDKVQLSGGWGTSVLCDIEECAYQRDGRCGKEMITIERKTSGEFRSGERVSYTACQDYKELGDDGAD